MKYRYLPLSTLPGSPNGVYSIRLLHLLPATSRAAKLECELIETDIPDNSHENLQPACSIDAPHDHASYQALSYTWGDPNFTSSLHVVARGDTEEAPATPTGVIGITENLHSALQNLRDSNRILVLWVDAVCIDQTNIPERNSQVSNIPQIYAGAASVLVWLGTDDLHSSGRLCLSFFTDLAAVIANEDPQQRYSVSWRKRLKINKMISDFLSIAQPSPIGPLLSRPWFRRRWIVQEVVLAKDVTVHCGETSIPWAALEAGLAELYKNDMGGFSRNERTVLRTMSHIRNAKSGAKSQVPLDTLVEFETFLCADPRDRLYALYGVIRKWVPSSMDHETRTGKVDYALSIGDVFTNFAILMLRLVDILLPGTSYHPVTHLLQLATAIQQPIGQEISSIPSWVPDWTGTLAYTPLDHSPPDRDASLGLPKRRVEVQTSSRNERLLLSAGLVYDIVIKTVSLDTEPLLGPVHCAKAELNHFLGSVAKQFDETEFFDSSNSDEYRPTGEHIISALATALIANWEQTPPNSYFAQHSRFRNDFLEQLGSSHYHLPEILHKWPAYVELITITMRGRCLFLSHAGYIGVASANIQEGDVVSILSDIRIPFILRPKGAAAVPVKGGLPYVPDLLCCKSGRLETSPSADGVWTPSSCTFRLISDAYVHGLMNGEALKQLGEPFGDSFQVISIA
ncbi:HET-domain-containing protein [Xylariaceae sp. FL0255]|nr:HET-domain-containing protein [Xylariaceae sp. FL0255]